MRRIRACATLAPCGWLLVACAASAPPTSPPGVEASTKTAVLEAGAALLQTSAPLRGMDIHLVGFHLLKAEPGHQMEAHHFCRQVNEEFAQCVLFDGNTADANLSGIEYIISERLFETLPKDERAYWHPHNYEILSGQLIAPGIPQAAERALMRGKMNSYGKTWHVWGTGRGLEHQDALPLGEAHLAWSFNRDGEARPGLVERRDARLGVDSGEVRAARQGLLELAHPQAGVDALEGRFERPTRAIAGVRDKGGEAVP